MSEPSVAVSVRVMPVFVTVQVNVATPPTTFVVADDVVGVVVPGHVRSGTESVMVTVDVFVVASTMPAGVVSTPTETEKDAVCVSVPGGALRKLSFVALDALLFRAETLNADKTPMTPGAVTFATSAYVPDVVTVQVNVTTPVDSGFVVAWPEGVVAPVHSR